MRKFFICLILILPFVTNAYSAEPRKIWFEEPKDGAKVKNPVKVCFGQSGLHVVEWRKDNVDGEGHHHVMIDVDFPKTLNYSGLMGPVRLVHYKTSCKTLRKPLSKGKHTLRGMFTNNNHRPYNPLIGTTITIEVVE